jgi:lantibiotic modifying enzyme
MKLLTIIFLLFGFSCFSQTQNEEQKLNTDSTNQEVALIKTSFVVSKKGKIKNIQILEITCETCVKNEKEKYIKTVREVLQKVPNLEKTDENGKPKDVKYILPIKIILE